MISQRRVKLTATAARFTVLVSVLGALVLPVEYFIDSYMNLTGTMEAAAKINARLVSEVVSRNPELWRYETVRLEHLLSQRLDQSVAETRTLFDDKNTVVAESSNLVRPPAVKASFPIESNGESVGRIEISRSLLPLLLRSLALMVVGTVIGLLLYRWLPFRQLIKVGEQLQASHDFLERVMQVSAVSLAVVDLTGNVKLCNERFATLVGRATDVLVGQQFCRLFPDDAAQEVKTALRRVSVDKEDGVDFELEYGQSDGPRRTLLCVAVPLSNQGVATDYIFSFSDISTRKGLEEKLRQAAKMESVGRLAGGVAHDFNNKLTVILGYVELLRLEVHDNPQAREALNQISQAAERSREITTQLLTFSRQQVTSPKVINLNTFLQDTEKTLPRLVGEDIVMSYVLPNDLWNVKIDPVQFDQIIMNLAINARDAMTNGGKIHIETANAAMEEEFCKEVEAGPADYVKVTFRDNGVGIDAETRKRLFEPFFTTKEVGKGTGLGLATVYGIVTHNGGFITVDSEPGQGTTFTIYLPRVEEEIASEVQYANNPVNAAGTILLVEDEETVRTVVARLLERSGYTVLVPMTPIDAITISENTDIKIDMVLSDIVMPEMNGKEMVKKIKALRPDIQVLFMSGYANDIISEKDQNDSTGFIQKPFDVNLLISMIGEQLSQCRHMATSSGCIGDNRNPSPAGCISSLVA